ncbi:relaxase/mobilization nuclease domain-containing protein [Bradyrhizobium sp. CCGUVB23]|uniref:relaxase/mobilization nuclease domain-containing protein n=1 Tax=Bradyrhizobium sp. CCGUVB23 TaxID=2949630 RepID=UPI0020B2AC10|nr:relaxase/mobilization nuclease domain-containing protein [Bradyrhizobium sp. CCGUVB23]MCP3468653.1 relaxase/mobilization nuclease domain-containing protein [Bradyrhizobium sp. CCGUVB23]
MSNLSQVVIRIVPHGGAMTPERMIKQWQYLSRNGKLELQLSARHLDIPLRWDKMLETARSWAWETGNYVESHRDEERDQDLTTHIVVSFPPGTDQEAAYGAGRGWAAKMFGSGFGGGQYNYLTAFHTDRGHPHLHVVVNRRELLGRGWLKISRRHPHLNYKALRTEMAEISRQHGIMLDASSRAERGLTERPMTFAEYRRRERGENLLVHSNMIVEGGSTEGAPSAEVSQNPMRPADPLCLHTSSSDSSGNGCSNDEPKPLDRLLPFGDRSDSNGPVAPQVGPPQQTAVSGTKQTKTVAPHGGPPEDMVMQWEAVGRRRQEEQGNSSGDEQRGEQQATLPHVNDGEEKRTKRGGRSR